MGYEVLTTPEGTYRGVMSDEMKDGEGTFDFAEGVGDFKGTWKNDIMSTGVRTYGNWDTGMSSTETSTS